jgi:quercetin dioxygenase-like cupin family protein
MAQPQFVIGQTEGDRIDISPGFGVVFRIAGQHTGGAFSVVEHPIQPRALVWPHVHEREDEYSYVLEGEIGVRIGEQELTAGPGAYVVKPRAIPHAFWNPTDQPARLLEIISPAGLEDYFRELGRLLAGPGVPDFAAIAALSQRYALVGREDWIPDLVQRYGLNYPM